MCCHLLGALSHTQRASGHYRQSRRQPTDPIDKLVCTPGRNEAYSTEDVRERYREHPLLMKELGEMLGEREQKRMRNSAIVGRYMSFRSLTPLSSSESRGTTSSFPQYPRTDARVVEEKTWV